LPFQGFPYKNRGRMEVLFYISSGLLKSAIFRSCFSKIAEIGLYASLSCHYKLATKLVSLQSSCGKQISEYPKENRRSEQIGLQSE
jgi:hypothetical protein